MLDFFQRKVYLVYLSHYRRGKKTLSTSDIKDFIKGRGRNLWLLLQRLMLVAGSENRAPVRV